MSETNTLHSTANKTENKPKLDRKSLSKALAIFQFVKPYRWSFIFGLLMIFFSSLTFMIFPFISGKMIDIAQGKTNFEMDMLGTHFQYELTLSKIGLLLAAVLVIQGFVSYLRVTLFAEVSEKGIADIRQALYQKMISLPIEFFEQNRVGELVSRLTADVEKLYNTFSVTLAEFLRQVIILISGLLFLAMLTPKLALIMLSTFPVVVIGAMFFGRYIRKLSKERQDEIANTNIILSETMQAINAVKAFTNEWFEVNRYAKSNANAVRVSMSYARRRALFAVFIVVVFFGALMFVLYEGALLLQAGKITAGDLVAFFTYTAIIGGAIAGLGNFYTELVGAIGATERVREILDTDGEVAVAKEAVVLTTPLQGNIQLNNVQFSYPTRPDVEVLKGINLDIKAGQKIALVGTSGAGKSTIIQLLLQFHKLSGGEIKVDGKDIYEYNISQYRRNMAIVPQEVMLFGGTIRENILYGKPDASDAEIIAAAQKSNSWDFIQSFPDGLQTIVGERGVKLSGGQRQRIAIARAILRNPSILILDEATSSLDAESEKVVQEALNELMKNRTSIIIAHRLATIREVDCIYVLDGGKIVERGTHDELSLTNGIYSTLAKLQFDAVH